MYFLLFSLISIFLCFLFLQMFSALYIILFLRFGSYLSAFVLLCFSAPLFSYLSTYFLLFLLTLCLSFFPFCFFSKTSYTCSSCSSLQRLEMAIQLIVAKYPANMLRIPSPNSPTIVSNLKLQTKKDISNLSASCFKCRYVTQRSRKLLKLQDLVSGTRASLVL